MRGSSGAQLWQRDFCDHIIRNEVELNILRQYIRTNPLRWAFDPDNEVDVGLPTRIEQA